MNTLYKSAHLVPAPIVRRQFLRQQPGRPLQSPALICWAACSFRWNTWSRQSSLHEDRHVSFWPVMTAVVRQINPFNVETNSTINRRLRVLFQTASLGLRGHYLKAISSGEIQIVPRHTGPLGMDCWDIPFWIRSPICKGAIERKTPLLRHTDDIFTVCKELVRLGLRKNPDRNPFRSHRGILPAPRKVRHDHQIKRIVGRVDPSVGSDKRGF